MAEKADMLAGWVDRYTEELLSWALHKTSGEETAKDLVQETFLAAAERLDSFKGDSSPKTWLFSILNNKIIDVYRKKGVHPVVTDSRILGELFDEHGTWKKDKRPRHWDVSEDREILHDEEFMAVLARCLEALPETWNTCVKLKYLTGKKGEEICREVGLSSSNYWQVIHRAKLQLRECMEDNWYEKNK